MSQASDFIKKLSADSNMTRELQLCYIVATVKFASMKGYSFTPDEYLEAASSNDEQLLDIDQLESVAGGVMSSAMSTCAVGEEGGMDLRGKLGIDWKQISS